jgi:hypothetical protein
MFGSCLSQHRRKAGTLLPLPEAPSAEHSNESGRRNCDRTRPPRRPVWSASKISAANQLAAVSCGMNACSKRVEQSGRAARSHPGGSRFESFAECHFYCVDSGPPRGPDKSAVRRRAVRLLQPGWLRSPHASGHSPDPYRAGGPRVRARQAPQRSAQHGGRYGLHRHRRVRRRDRNAAHRCVGQGGRARRNNPHLRALSNRP